MTRASRRDHGGTRTSQGGPRRQTRAASVRRTAFIAPFLAAALSAPVGSAMAQTCQLVPGNSLEAFYPVMPGWTRGMPTSETDPSESVSRTTVDFDRDTETISVELMDTCRRVEVLQQTREVLKAFPPATPGTTQRHTTVNGFPAYEEFTAESGHGEIHVLVADRFMVKVTAETSNLPTLQNAARLVPMAKLAAVK